MVGATSDEGATPVPGECHQRHTAAGTESDQDRIAAHAVAVALTTKRGRQVEGHPA
jgi:hypothetical protein